MSIEQRANPLDDLMAALRGDNTVRAAFAALEHSVRLESENLHRADRLVEQLFEDGELRHAVDQLKEGLPNLAYLQSLKGTKDDHTYSSWIGRPTATVHLAADRVLLCFRQLGIACTLDTSSLSEDPRQAFLAIDMLKGTYEVWRASRVADIAAATRSVFGKLTSPASKQER